jgi:hypothetical protein
MSNARIDKARAAALKAQQELEAAEAAELERAEHVAAKRESKQRELDAAFLAEWESLDSELEAAGSKSAGDAIYEGADPIAAVAVFWVARAKRNAVRAHARDAYFRLHGEHPAGNFASHLNHRDVMIASQLDDAISYAATLHAADLADELDAKWLVSESEG